MKDFRQRKKSRNYLYSPIILMILFLVLLFLAKSAYNSYSKKNRAYIEQQKIEHQYSQLSDKINYLTSKIKKLKSDEGMIEELKKNNNVGEVGETIIRIVESRS